MAPTIKQGMNKNLLCKVGLHKWRKWIRHSILSSNIVDLERKCEKCGQVKRRAISGDFEYGYDD
jgi:hypothetical protein